MKRFSVLYLLSEQYQHIGCTTHLEAEAILHQLSTDPKRTPVGIYDAKTELFEWDSSDQDYYDRASIGQQGMWADQIITIAQALRRRDSSWHIADGFQRPGFFA